MAVAGRHVVHEGCEYIFEHRAAERRQVGARRRDRIDAGIPALEGRVGGARVGIGGEAGGVEVIVVAKVGVGVILQDGVVVESVCSW